MKVNHASNLFILILFVPMLAQPTNLFAQEVTVRSDEEVAVETMRLHYFNRTFNMGIEEGEKLMQTYPSSVELKAWYTAVLARDDQAEKAMGEANKLRKEYPDSPWALFAYIRALNVQEDRFDEALKLADELIAMDPDNPYFYWLKGATLSNSGDSEAVIEYLNTLDGELSGVKVLRSLLASNLLSSNYQSTDEEGKKEFERGLGIYKQLRTEDPEWVDAYYLPAFYLNYAGNKEQAFELIQRGVNITMAHAVHTSYWRALVGNDGLSREEKLQKLNEDADYITSSGAMSSDMMLSLAHQYGELAQKDKQKELEDRILNEFPESVNAEWVLVNRYRAFRSENQEAINENDPEAVAEYEAMLWDFLERPQHNRDRLIGDAYRNLYYLEKNKDQSDTEPEVLLEIVNGMAKYEGINVHTTHGNAPAFLAEKTEFYSRAKEIAREGIGLAEEKIQSQKERGSYETEEEYIKAVGWYTGIIYDGLGWIYYQEGKLDSAQQYLSKSYSLFDTSKENIYHLGKLNEALGNFSKAESYYREGVKLQGMGKNPNEKALRDLYVKNNGSEENFEAYLASVREGGKKDRKEEILSEVIEDPELIASFELNNLEGKSLSSSELKGKIVMINVWGTWCGPCVQEMPEIQKLHEKYKGNPDVEVLTINNDPDIGKVRTWMAEHEYTFEVLRDDGYLNQNAVYVFPTTWFTNTNSEIKFIQEGYTEALVEEFTWRVDYLSMAGE